MLALFRAPHRALFFSGAVSAAAAGLWWGLEIAGRAVPGALLPAPQVAPLWVHALLMQWGLFGPFIFGFLLTTFPRWQNGPEAARPVYVALFVLWIGGIGLALAGVFAGATWLAAAAALMAVAWWLGWLQLLAIMLRARQIAAHAVVAAIALGLAGAALVAYAWAMHSNDAVLAHAALRFALWAGLVPLVHAVCHRMLPFFSQGVIPGYTVYRPMWRLVAVSVLAPARALLALAGAFDWLWALDAALFFITLTSGLRWQPLSSRGTPLLWTLYVAYLWLPLGLALQAIADASYALTGEFALGRAPLHALGIGFLSSLLLAMATRVTMGHSGRALVMDRFTLACFLLLQAAAVLRVGSELVAGRWPVAFLPLLMLAAVAWLAGFVPWAIRYGRMYLVPRIDGRPG